MQLAQKIPYASVERLTLDQVWFHRVPDKVTCGKVLKEIFL